ncbi:alpha/beta-hydrolase [Periconia macrospinosa]|uniref:Alpha/beta-hydrolase n=1 Tax=Periconia macrospinosa TaxID=97972 RepID=A0A2V1E286_9PLEO|nr:alpha/beta-hydrolase [Periconia macrospinosa]
MSARIIPYKIAVPAKALETLQKKLSLASFPGETAQSDNWAYGAPRNDIKRLVEYWQTTFDWRRAEAEINKLPQFTASISVEGHGPLQIHFVHQKSSKANSIPLLFCHGWPGSFLEVTKILPLLTSSDSDGEQTFHVVAPSLPNFGFSQRTSEPGFGVQQHAEVCHKLMLELGYNKYVTQAGDLGFFISRAMGSLYPDNALGSHMNFIVTIPPSPISTPFLVLQYLTGMLSADEKEGLKRSQEYNDSGSGYRIMHQTRPHTIGYALADSPVALLAWIYEKLHDWTDNYNWTDDEVLTWVSIYLFSSAGADASVRVYNDLMSREADIKVEALLKYTKVPLGISYFPRDVIVLPSSWGRTLGPVLYEKRHKEGGHFAAHERPELLVADVRKFVQTLNISA